MLPTSRSSMLNAWLLPAASTAWEMWALYEAGTLHPASVLTGEFDEPEELADVGGVIREIEAARLDEERRQAIRAADDAPQSKVPDEPPPPPWMQ